MDLNRTATTSLFQFFKTPDNRMAADVQGIGAGAAFALAGSQPPLAKVIWYPAPAGAKVFRPPHIWGNCLWFTDEQMDNVTFGEQPDSFKWTKDVVFVGATGQRYCGSVDNFTELHDWNPLAAKPVIGPTGLPKCCLPSGLFVLTVGTASPSNECFLCGDAVLSFAPLINIVSTPPQPWDGVWATFWTKFPLQICLLAIHEQVTPLPPPSGGFFSISIQCVPPSLQWGFFFQWFQTDDPGNFWNTGVSDLPLTSAGCTPTFHFDETFPIFFDNTPTGITTRFFT